MLKRNKLSEEHKAKISRALKGRILSKETRQKMSLFQKGKRLSEETKKKISEAKKHIGAPWMVGRKFSLEHRKNLSKVKIGNHNGIKTQFRKGSHPVEFYRNSGLRSVISQRNMKGPTSIEKIVYDLLKNKGIIFEKQKLINGKFIVDVYIPDLNLIIECDGDYWHGLDRVKNKDKAENAYLTKCGFGLVRLSETEINNGSFEKKLFLRWAKGGNNG